MRAPSLDRLTASLNGASSPVAMSDPRRAQTSASSFHSYARTTPPVDVSFIAAIASRLPRPSIATANPKRSPSCVPTMSSPI
eukprot:31301-Pelagococcus_subviridis.AAC.5